MTVADLSVWELRRSAEPVGDLFDELLADRQFSDPAMQVGPSGEITLAADAALESATGRPVICELRQHAATLDVSWTAAQEGYLSASLTINSLPVDYRGGAAPISILRVHGASGELAALRYDGRHMLLELSRSPAVAHNLLAADGSRPAIALGDRFDCFVRVTMTTVTVSLIHGGRTYLCSAEIGRAWLTSALHFSAGVCFDGDAASGQAEVTFFSLTSPTPARSPRRSQEARRSVASAELVVRLADGEQLSFPVALEQRRQLRH